MPSSHVWLCFVLPPLPQFLNQEPPRPQQLAWPDFLMVPHLEHTDMLGDVVVPVFICVYQVVEQTQNCLTVAVRYIPSALDLPSQACTPSIHLCSTCLLPVPPHFLYQAPPGAQQLIRPDFSNVPHFEHVIALAFVRVMEDVLIVVLVMSSRLRSSWSSSNIG